MFSKVKISYQTTILELVADFSTCKYSISEMKKKLPKALENLNGIFELISFEEFN